MSDRRDVKTEKFNDQQQTLILRKVPNTSLGLINNNRFLIYIIVALMMLVLVMGFLLFPKDSMLEDYQLNRKASELQNLEMNPVVSAEISKLKSQLIGLLSGSIESKLRILEENIKSGSLNVASMGAIQDLKNDVQVLKTYTESGSGRLIVEKYANNQSVSAIDRHLLQEVTQLKNLLYISIGSCGLMLAAMGGVWLQSRYRLGQDEHKASSSDHYLGK